MQEKTNTLRIILAAAVLVSLAASIVSAAPSTESITYQGKLMDAAGNPLTGTYTVAFNLYDSATGGTALATDTHSVTAANGLFTTQITFDPSLFDGRGLWLGISVGSDAEMTPRQEIRPVPYALKVLGSSSDSVLSIVQDIQTTVNSILTNVTVLRTDVTTIKNGMGKPAKPIQYEYYTGIFDALDDDGSYALNTGWMSNMGDSAADACSYVWTRDGSADWLLRGTRCQSVEPGERLVASPSVVARTGGSFVYRVKFTTNSPYMVPMVSLNKITGETIEQFHAGDFQKVEIYS